MHGQTKLYTRAPIYIMVMHKEAIYSTGILATLKLKLTAKRLRERELYLSSLSNADICGGEDYCYFIINN